MTGFACQSVVFAYDDEQQRKRWSNFPLSRRELEKVQQIMDADENLKSTEGNGRGGGRGGGPGGRGGGGGLMFVKDLYFISIPGTPSEKNPWMLQWGGHHLALNITIDGTQGFLRLL